MRERDTVNETTFLYIKKGPEETVLDFYQSPAVMVSAVVRQVFSMYEDGITFKKVYLVDLERGLSHNFYIPSNPRLAPLSFEVCRYPVLREKKVILDRGKCRGHHVFFLEESMSRRPVLSLAAVESLLRRRTVGMKFQEVEVR